MSQQQYRKLIFFTKDFVEQVKVMQQKQQNTKMNIQSNIQDTNESMHQIDDQIIQMSYNVFTKIHKFCTPEQIADGSAVILAAPSVFEKNIKYRREFIQKYRTQIDEIQHAQEAQNVLYNLQKTQKDNYEDGMYQQLNYYIRKYEKNRQ